MLPRLCFVRRATRSQRGMTLLETVITAVIGVIVTAAVTEFGIYMANMNKSTFSQLKFAQYTRQTIENIAKVVRYSKRLQVTDGGTKLLCTDENNVTSSFYYSDVDRNAVTLADNRIYYISNINVAGPTPVMVGRYISPFPNTPIFAYLDRTSAVEIRFRVGDPRSDPRGLYDNQTGPGPQGLDVRAAFGPRNSYLE